MAKAMKMGDRKDYVTRIHSSVTGHYNNDKSMSDRSRYLNLKYNIEHKMGMITEYDKQFMRDYEANELIVRNGD